MESELGNNKEAILRRINTNANTNANANANANANITPVFVRGKEKKGMPVIIGGMVLDIHATSSVPVTSKSTTPGKVEYMLGGVARNIAECLIKLGARPYMISAVGQDMAGDRLLELWRSYELPMEGIQQGQDIKTAIVCNMFNIDGDLTGGVASVQSIERHVNPQWIQQFKSVVHGAPMVMVDANLSPEALETSCQMAAELKVPVWFEPVSVAKSKRVSSVANYITFASPNEHELIAMANALSRGDPFRRVERSQDKANGSIESLFQELKPAVTVLLEKGIKFVLVTVGADGALLCSRGGSACWKECLNGTKYFQGRKELFEMVTSRCPAHMYSSSTKYRRSSGISVTHFPALSATVGRVSGAGDCLVGGVLASLCSGLNVMQSVAAGIATAKVAIEVETNVPQDFNLTAVADDARTVYRAARVIFQESAL